MKIGIISDTHDRLTTFRQALEMFRQRQVEAIVHAGDIIAPFAAKLIAGDAVDVPVHVIYGNNDGERAGLARTLPRIQDGPMWLDLGERTILVHHYLGWLEPSDYAEADVIVTGHDHTAHVQTRGDQLFLNPGECCGWVTGRCTAAILETETPRAEVIDVPL